MRLTDNSLSLREHVAGVIDAGKTYARAEIAYFRQLATAKVKAIAISAAFAIAALMIVQAALTVLLAALGLWLSRWLGPAGGLAVAAVLGLLIAGALAMIGVRRITGAGASS